MLFAQLRRGRIAVVGVGLAGLLAACGDDSSGGVTYRTLNYPQAAPGGSTLLTGVRGVSGSSDVYVTGIYETPEQVMHGLVYQGALDGDGTWYRLDYPSSDGITVTSTGLYGPNGNAAGGVTIVGNYTAEESGAAPIGLLYQGPLDGSGAWRTLMPPDAAVAIAHSTMGGLVVGNYETRVVAATGKAFIYDIARDDYTELVKPGALSITAYGIWYNGGTSYTIAGGFADASAAAGYLVDWDSATQRASNWTAYQYRNQSRPTDILTHFEGITGVDSGGYHLAADSVLESGDAAAAFVSVARTSSGGFGTAHWTTIAYPHATLTSANTVFESDVLGIYQLSDSGVSSGYVASVH